MTDNDNILSEPQMHQTYEVARAVNAVNDKVEGLQGQADAHEAMIETLFRWLRRVEGLGEQRRVVAERDAAVTACEKMRAERDALQARVAELEADAAEARAYRASLTGVGSDERCPRCGMPLIVNKNGDKWCSFVECSWRSDKQQEADAALGALVRRMQRRVIVERFRDGTYSVGLRGEPRVYFCDEERTFAWAADAALGEEVTDAE